MKILSIGLIIGTCWTISVSAFAASGCDFVLPVSKFFKFNQVSSCNYEISNHVNYGGGNYLIFDNQHGVNYVLGGGDIFYQENGKYYSAFDEVDNSKYTQNQIRNSPAKVVSVNGLKGYFGRWVGFMQALPDYEKNNGYSSNVKCISAVVGDGGHVLKTRFCAPDTVNGNKLLKKYESMIFNVKLTNR